MTRAATTSPIADLASDAASVSVVAKDRGARLRLACLLAGEPNLRVRAAPSANELIGSGASCELLVFHCQDVGSKELALFAELRQEFPEIRIITVCESANGRSARRAVDGGIDGLVFADELDAALPPTVAAVLAGQTVVPRSLRASVRKLSLSFREKQILGMVVMGFTNGEIGSRLYLAESTVKSHLSSAFSKLGVRSRSEAAAVILDPHGSLGPGILAITCNGGAAPAITGNGWAAPAA